MDLHEQLQHALGSAYSLERELQRGGMARVFVATDTRLRRSVVVKVLAPELAADVSSERFQREIQLAASLQHANIVPVLSAGDMDGVPYYTMPYVEGESLRILLQNGPLSISETVSILRDVARALGYAHARGIIHRDIKPDNVLLSHGAAVVTDFGIAKAISAARATRQESTLTQAGAAIGTPAYMAPEQVACDPDIDDRADLYAFGCMAYELLTARPPFTDLSRQRVVAAQLTETPRPVRELRPDVPASLATLVMRCLEKRPADRPESADDITRSLGAIAAPAVPIGRGTSTSVATRRRWQFGIAALGGIAIVVAGLKAWGVGRPHLSNAEEAVAVLPLANLSGDKANDYFTEGLAEEITDAVRRTGARVIGPRGVGALAAKGLDVREIGRRLNVSAVLQGSLQQAGDNVRITVSLISARDGSSAWSHKYDEQFKDVFAVEDSIAYGVANELQVRLTGGARAMLAHRETDDPEAHALYIQGIFLWNRRTATTLKQAISYFQRAVDRDPRYARAYAGLGLSYGALPDYADVDVKESTAKAIEAAERALVLDSTLAEAYVVIANSNARVFRNANAISAYRRAIALDSTSATAHHWYALLLGRLGQFDQAIHEIQWAQRLEPASVVINSNAGVIHSMAGRSAAAESILRRALELDSNFASTRFKLGIVLLERGKLAQASVELERAVALSGPISLNYATLADSYALSGRTAEARHIIAELTAGPASARVSRSAVALVYSALGDDETALKWLERAVNAYDPFLQFWSRDSRFDRLRADPRGRALFDQIEKL